MSEDSTTISTLEYGCSGGALQVHILRTWTPQIRSYETWFLAVDKHGDTIQILGQKKDQGHIKSILTISNCYTISDYACAEPDEYQNWIGKEINISVVNASSICRIPDTRITPTTSFHFIFKSQIPDYVKQAPGVFVKSRELKTKNKEPYTLLILTTESDKEIPIGLWKECTNVLENFDRNLIEATPAPTVLAVTNAKIMTVEDTTDSITANLSENTVEKLNSITSEKAIQQHGHTHRKTLPPFIQD
ncbi:unnamed protein product [Lactuca virosa]|uniref:DUF223 domain-containing protein n=1 Tax=Lactuca virosa TaxID=75947 RepID=A0AAU9MMR1_9ASTR|nr:unnamed protein product [Lactuca virosa]